MKARELFYIQIVTFVLLFFLGSLEAVVTNIFLLVPSLVGVAITLYSIYTLGPKSFSPFPFPTKNSEFIEKGLYKSVRHPMYFGLEIIGLALVLSNLRLESVLVFLFLIYILNLKADLEEELLSQKFPQYAEYKIRTRKFIPY